MDLRVRTWFLQFWQSSAYKVQLISAFYLTVFYQDNIVSELL